MTESVNVTNRRLRPFIVKFDFTYNEHSCFKLAQESLISETAVLGLLFPTLRSPNEANISTKQDRPS